MVLLAMENSQHAAAPYRDKTTSMRKRPCRQPSEPTSDDEGDPIEFLDLSFLDGMEIMAHHNSEGYHVQIQEEAGNDDDEDEATDDGTQPILCSEPRPFDVIMGRGRGPAMHTGNRRLDVLVNVYKSRYYALESKSEKTAMTQEIVDIITKSGRFIVKTSRGGYIEATNRKARLKVGQKLRYEYPVLRRSVSMPPTSSHGMSSDQHVAEFRRSVVSTTTTASSVSSATAAAPDAVTSTSNYFAYLHQCPREMSSGYHYHPYRRSWGDELQQSLPQTPVVATRSSSPRRQDIVSDEEIWSYLGYDGNAISRNKRRKSTGGQQNSSM